MDLGHQSGRNTGGRTPFSYQGKKFESCQGSNVSKVTWICWKLIPEDENDFYMFIRDTPAP